MTSEEKFLPRFLFLSVFLLLLAFYICNNIINNSNLILPLMAGFYSINLLSFLMYIFKRKISIKKNNFVIMFLLLFCSLFTVIFNFNGTISKEALYDLINAFIKVVNLFCYILVFSNIKFSKKQILYLMKLFVILGVFSCLYNAVFNFNEIVNFYKITSTYDLSLCSVFSNRNQFGAYLFLSIVAYTFLLDSNKMTFKNYFIYILFICNIVLTMSRGAILATFIFIIYNLFKEKKYKTIFISILGLILLTIIVSNFFPLFSFLKDNILRLDSGTTGRTNIWNIALNIWKKSSIFFGTGYYNGLKIAKVSYGFKYSQFHSLYFDILVDGGLALLFIVLNLLVGCYRKSKKCSDTILKDTMTGAFISIFALSIFESVNFLSLGYADMLYTVFFMTIPIILSNMNDIQKGGKEYVRK